MYSRKGIIRDFALSEMIYLGKNGLDTDESCSEFYWHFQHELVEYHWNNAYKVHPDEVIKEINQTIDSGYACQQADYGNWMQTKRITYMQKLIEQIELQIKLATW